MIITKKGDWMHNYAIGCYIKQNNKFFKILKVSYDPIHNITSIKISDSTD